MHPDTPLEKIFRLRDEQKRALAKLNIVSALDLLYHFPTRYGDTAAMRSIGSLAGGDMAVVFGTIRNLKSSKAFYKKIPMAEGDVEDDTGRIKAIWFNQPYITKLIGEGSLVRVEGKVSARRKTGDLYLSNPKIEKVLKLPIGVGDSLFGGQREVHSLYPVYPESRGITSHWLFHILLKIFKSGTLETIEDPIPADILKKYNLPHLKTALIWIHTPRRTEDARAARKRFAFEEVFLIQLERQHERLLLKTLPTHTIKIDKNKIKKFLARFPFAATEAQKQAIETILDDLESGTPMSRLLEGDVGSGKTLVAAVTAYGVIETPPSNNYFGRLQVAYMAPTEILARQHFESFIQFFKHLNITIALITGSECLKFPSKVNPNASTYISRRQLLKWVGGGEISILIGTHTLIQKSVEFKHLGYVVIDEQHRFGVTQRRVLVRRETRSASVPHLLSMTATPIPRTLALTVFGDLDLTLLDEMPPGRKPILSEIVLPTEREHTYEKIRREIATGRQVYVICPRIDEPDPTKALALNVKSVKAEAARLKRDIFPNCEIGILHSKMKPAEKDKVMLEFSEGRVDILCSTSVVEVGVNVPNATVIVIEGAERFGLAQLHQLRGRVQRSSNQAYCYIFTESAGEKTVKRLAALRQAKNGFELAELDLKSRGSGALSGSKQWGVSDIAMEALQNLKMVEVARSEAARLVAEDPDLSKFPHLKIKISSKKSIHFE